MDTNAKPHPPAVSTASLPTTFIVRLYRIDRERPALITGTLETIDGRAPQSFRSAAELIALLTASTDVVSRLSSEPTRLNSGEPS